MSTTDQDPIAPPAESANGGALVELAALPVEELERRMLALPQAEAGVRHHFLAGLYIREVTIPADTYAIGHKHRLPHINVLTRGAVAMVQADGRTVEVRAPLMYIGVPGRKVGYIREAMTWLNIWPTPITDVEKLEALLFEKSEAFQEASAAQLAGPEPLPLIEYDREDYSDWLTEMGASEEELEARFRGIDYIAWPSGSYKVKVGRSRIEGRGLIATADIAAGEVIAPARIGDQRTPAGRFTNHARDPNARMLREGNTIYLVALRAISGCHGGFDGEEVTVNYRQAVAEARAS